MGDLSQLCSDVADAFMGMPAPVAVEWAVLMGVCLYLLDTRLFPWLIERTQRKVDRAGNHRHSPVPGQWEKGNTQCPEECGNE